MITKLFAGALLLTASFVTVQPAKAVGSMTCKVTGDKIYCYGQHLDQTTGETIYCSGSGSKGALMPDFYLVTTCNSY